jgi:hypothetical protein
LIEIPSVGLSFTKETVSSPFHYQDLGRGSFYLNVLVEINNFCFVSKFLKLGGCLFEFWYGEAMVCFSANNLHAFVVLGPVPKGNRNSAHLFYIKVVSIKELNSHLLVKKYF